MERQPIALETDMITTYKAFIGDAAATAAAQEYFHAWQTYRKVREEQQVIHQAEQDAQRKLISARNALWEAHGEDAGVVYLVAPGTGVRVTGTNNPSGNTVEIVKVINA